ncbi:anti-repressor SinI family protein [Niallia sp. NCCP-28]|nr:anti-repressor SinI family protein [Niallia sp. NCCP-28]GKU83437.1 hypothetical protein NCCP28_28330 [Niallia sp. NCCP-28]
MINLFPTEPNPIEELDLEWLKLILEAKELGLTPTQIYEFLESKK